MKSILVINISNIGDIVSSFSVIKLLSTYYKIDFYTLKHFSDLFFNEKFINIVDDSSLKKKKYDIIVDLTSSSSSRKLVKRIKADIKIGMYNGYLNYLKSRLIYSNLVPKNRYNHIVYNYYSIFDMFKHIDKKLLEKYPTLTPIIDQKYTDTVVIHIGARNPIRAIPDRLLFDIIEYINNNFSYKIYILGDNIDKLKAIKRRYEFVFFEQTTLFDVKKIISNSKLFIGPDSGLLHIALALNIDSIGIYGPNIPEVCAPLNKEKLHIVQKDFDCRPCNQNKECPYNRKCLIEISFDADLKDIISNILK